MSDVLEEALRESGGGLTLDRPVSDVIERGDRLRRRRARGLVAAGAAVAAVVATGVSLAVPPSSSPTFQPAAAAAWGPRLVNLEPAELGEAGQVCFTAFREELGWDAPVGLQPVAADSRGNQTILFYRFEDEIADCTLQRRGDRLRPDSFGHDTWSELADGNHYSFLFLKYSSDAVRGPVRDALGGAQVSDDVARFDLTVAGQTLEATVENGIAMFWFPQGITSTQIDDTTVVVYDDQGNVLDSGPL